MSNIPLNPPDIDFVDYRDPIWGDSYNWSWNRPLNLAQYLVIHHSVTIHEATPDDIALLHKARGWGGIGYHFVITKDGTVYYVGDIGTARANVKSMNEKVIGICLIGDFTKHLPSDQQIISAHKLCQFFISNYPALENITGWDKMLVGHKDLQSTACPGSSWGASAPDHLKWRITTGTPYSPIVEPIDWEKKYKEDEKTWLSWKETAESLTTFKQRLAEALGVADDVNTIAVEVKELVEKEDRETRLETALNSMFAKVVKVANVKGFQKAWTESSDEEREIILSEFDKTSTRLTQLAQKASTLESQNKTLKKKLESIREKRASELASIILSIFLIIKSKIGGKLLPKELPKEGGESNDN